MRSIIAAVLLAVGVSTLAAAPQRYALRRNGHNVQVVNQSSGELVITAWSGAAPIRLRRGATAWLPTPGGPVRWDLTIADAAGAVRFSSTLSPGGPRTIRVADKGARMSGPESDFARKPLVNPDAKPEVKP